MKRLLIVLGIVGVVVGSPSVHAAEHAALQKAKGGVRTVDAVITGSAERVTGVSFACGSTACVVSLYDTDGLGGTSAANCVWEGSAIANDGKSLTFDPPIRTTTGLTVVVDANVTGVVVYTEQPTP